MGTQNKIVSSIKNALSSVKLAKYNQLFKDYKTLSIKEVTNFKYLKSISKLSFKSFMMKSSTDIYSLIVLPDKMLIISGGNEGYIRLWNLESLLILKLLNFHTSCVSSLDIEPDSNFLLSCGYDRMICLWNLNKLQLCRSIKGHESFITFANFLKSSKYFITGSFDKSLKIWKTFTFELIRVINLNSMIYCMCFLNHSKSIVAVGIERFILGVDLKNKINIGAAKLLHQPLCCVYYKKEKLIFIGDDKGYVQVIIAANLRAFRSFEAHSGRINSIDICESRFILATGSIDGRLKIWKLPSLDLCKTINVFYFEVYCLILQFGKLFVSGADSKIYIFETPNGNLIKASNNHQYSQRALAFSLNLEFIALGLESLEILCLKSGLNVSWINLPGRITQLRFFKSIILCATSLGRIYYLTAPYLELKQQFFATKNNILFLNCSRDFKKLVYSTENKSTFIDFGTRKVVLNSDFRIDAGEFIEKNNNFVFIKELNEVYIFKNYLILEKIVESPLQIYCQLYPFIDKWKLILRNGEGDFILIDINKKIIQSKGKKLRHLGKGSKFKKRDILNSCLSYHNFLS